MTALDHKPQWIAHMYPTTVGRDHLGLGSVSSGQILASLSPAINVLSYHPRYHSFYVFLLDEFWRLDRPRSRKAWKEFFRPREFIFSLGGHLCERPEHGDMSKIVGGDTTGPLASEELPTYDTATNYIKSDLGGYGLYYRSVMIDLGLIYPGGPGFPIPMDAPSEKGKLVAEAFRTAVRETDYYRRYFAKDATKVPIEIIREYIHRACLCQLKRPDAPDRALVLDAFLHGGGQAEARRQTFRMFLDIAAQSRRQSVDQRAFRQLLYFGESEEGARYTPRPEVTDTYRRWRLYQAREYYAFALNAFWYHLCEWGIANHGDIRPLALSQFWAHIDDALDFNHLASLLEVKKPNLKASSGFQQLLDWIKQLIGRPGTSFETACTLTTAVNENLLTDLAREDSSDPVTMVAGMLTMLALIFLRYGDPATWVMPVWNISQMGSDGRLSLQGFLSQVLVRLKSGPVTIREVVQWLFRDYVILQHQMVATGKLPENTFRFEREGDRLRFYNLPNFLTFNDSRFDAISTTVFELGLCGDLTSTDHGLTRDGQRLLIEGNL